MVLENLVRRSWELRRCRRFPLGMEADGFCKWMHEQGYSPSVMRGYFAKFSQFNWYLRNLGIKACSEIQELHADRFIGRHSSKYGRISSGHRSAAIRCLMKYLSIRGILSSTAQPPPYEGLLNAYAADLRHHRGLADGTIKIYCHYLIPLLQSLDGEDVLKSLSEISPQHVHAFFAKQGQGKSDTTRGQIQATLRNFFLSLCEERICRRSSGRGSSESIPVPAGRCPTPHLRTDCSKAPREYRPLDAGRPARLRHCYVAAHIWSAWSPDPFALS